MPGFDSQTIQSATERVNAVEHTLAALERRLRSGQLAAPSNNELLETVRLALACYTDYEPGLRREYDSEGKGIDTLVFGYEDRYYTISATHTERI